jgi:enterochelin esterase-like enzyme
MRRLVAFLLLLALLVPAAARAGELQLMQFDSPRLKRSWTYSVYRPDGYATTSGRFPVLYFLHGSSRIVGDWRQLDVVAMADAEIAAGRMKPSLIVVPEMGASWGVDGPEAMESAFIHDLVPHVQATERVYDDMGGRAICGISAGGFAALRYALRYPDMFAAVALMSPAIYHRLPPVISGARKAPAFGPQGFDPLLWKAANYTSHVDDFLRLGRQLPVYVGSGDHDRLGIQDDAAWFERMWRRRGQPAELHLVPGDHTYTVWRQLFPNAIDFALARTRPPGP